MSIINKTKAAILSKNCILCSSVFSKSIGLMFSKIRTLIFVNKEEEFMPLHMLFVFYPIDVIYLNENKEVVEVKEDFKPFSFYNPKNKAKYVIELPAGKIKKSRTFVGDKITFKNQ